MSKLNEIMGHFATEDISKYGNGHINDTYLTTSGNFILQRINTNIFKNPDELMSNIEKVTGFLRDKIISNGGDADRETLTVVKTLDGKSYYRDKDDCYRVYKFVEDSITIEAAETQADMYKTGKGFGKFCADLDDFPAESLSETIVDFHNTPKRLENLKKAIKENKAGRAVAVKNEIDFVMQRADFTNIAVNAISDGSIPLRVTHNDTKINNILFDKATRDALCVIDLDTVMQGSSLYDFGDALRVGASTAAEDETDLTKVKFDVEMFKAFTKGYLEETVKILTPKEMQLLPYAAKLLTLECGMRFLTDYLEGDTYFKIHREHHNLDRARTQFKLVYEMERIQDELCGIVKNICSQVKMA